MSDTTSFGFGKFVPGFDFLQSLAKGASGHIPQMPHLSKWVAPTINVEELDKRVEELRAVQFWLEQNSRALAATIQALEVQRMTLATLQGMNFNMGDVANAFKLKTADAVMGGVGKAGEGFAQAAQAVSGAAARAAEFARPAADGAGAPQRDAGAGDEDQESNRDADGGRKAGAKAEAKKSTAKNAGAGAASVIDPVQWWGALTQQFQEIAGAAMKDAARHTAMDATRNLATGLAKDALKTATGVAGQMAAQGVKNMQGAARAVVGSPATKKASGTKKAPARKAAAQKAPTPRKTSSAPASRASSSQAKPKRTGASR